MKNPIPHTGILLVVSGPAGTGKTTVCERMLAEEPALRRVITCTTRPPREGEREGEAYYFLGADEFEKKVAAGDFYEYATVHGYRYGTLKKEVDDKLAAGDDLLLNIDVQGAATFRETAPKDDFLRGRMATVFIMPPSLEELERRLRSRQTDDEETIQNRLKGALEEIEHCDHYDYCLPSSSRGEDFDRLYAIYLAETMRVRILAQQGVGSPSGPS